jgi:hypothetical protein
MFGYIFIEVSSLSEGFVQPSFRYCQMIMVIPLKVHSLNSIFEHIYMWKSNNVPEVQGNLAKVKHYRNLQGI